MVVDKVLPMMTALAWLLTAEVAFAQGIATDKLSYQPGEKVVITGEGWQPQEAILMSVTRSSASRPAIQISVTAAADGTFAASFIPEEADRDQVLMLRGRGSSGAETMIAVRAGAAAGTLRCSSATLYDSNHYAISPSQKVTCSIEGAADLSAAQQGGSEPVEVVVRSGRLGAQRARILSVTGTTINFEYAAPTTACGITTVSYGPIKACDTVSGDCASLPTEGNDASAMAMSGKDSAAGFVFIADGKELPCAPPRLKVEKLPGNGSFSHGGTASYSIVVSNPDSDWARCVKLFDQLPGNGGLVWQNVSTTQGSCSDPIANNAVNCSLGDIAPGGTVSVTVSSTELTPSAACQRQPNLNAIATASGGSIAFGSGSLTCTAATSPQLKVVKSPKNGTFVAGSIVSFTIVVSNPAITGSASAMNVHLVDQLPTNGGLTWTTTAASRGSCSISGNNLDCSLGDIPAGESVTVTVSSPTHPPLLACQLQSSVAKVAADGGLSAQDTASLGCKPLESKPALAMTKTAGNATPAPGEAVTYTYTVTNTGNVELRTVRISDDNGTPNNTADDFTVATIPKLAAGATATSTATAVPSNSSIVARLGSTGPAGFTVLSLGGDASNRNAGIFCSKGTVNGNLGIPSYGKFNNMSPCTENGSLYKGTNVSMSGSGKLNGSTITDDPLLNKLRTDAIAAASYFATLPVTASVQAQFPPNGSISGNRTVTGTPGMNVVNLPGLRLNGNLTLTGPAGTQFVLNISGDFNLHTGNITGGGSVGAYDIVYNITNPTASVTTMVPTTAVGILLAPNNGIYMDSSYFYGEIIGGYNETITLISGTNVVPPAPPAPKVTNTATASTVFGGATVSATATSTVTITY